MKAFEDDPSQARPLFKEVKKQGSEYHLLKPQFTTFKDMVNQRLWEYGESADFVSEKFHKFE